MTSTDQIAIEEFIAQRIDRSKREIEADMQEGVLPSDVPDFSALHDYVDANEYGGLCEDFQCPEVFTDDPEGDLWWAACNRIQDGVNDWLKSRR
jgi:hypothetical protein